MRNHIPSVHIWSVPLVQVCSSRVHGENKVLHNSVYHKDRSFGVRIRSVVSVGLARGSGASQNKEHPGLEPKWGTYT